MTIREVRKKETELAAADLGNLLRDIVPTDYIQDIMDKLERLVIAIIREQRI